MDTMQGPTPVLETKSLQRLGIRVQNPRVFHALSGVDRELLRMVQRYLCAEGSPGPQPLYHVCHLLFPS